MSRQPVFSFVGCFTRADRVLGFGLPGPISDLLQREALELPITAEQVFDRRRRPSWSS
jgi:hypothetical protein